MAMVNAKMIGLALCCALLVCDVSASRRRNDECGIKGNACCDGGECNGDGLVCFFGRCKACGSRNDLCCDGQQCGVDSITGENLTCTPYENRCRACGTHVGSPCCEDDDLPCNPNNDLMCSEVTTDDGVSNVCVSCGYEGEPCCPSPAEGNELFGCMYGYSCVSVDALGGEKRCVDAYTLTEKALGIEDNN